MSFSYSSFTSTQNKQNPREKKLEFILACLWVYIYYYWRQTQKSLLSFLWFLTEFTRIHCLLGLSAGVVVSDKQLFFFFKVFYIYFLKFYLLIYFWLLWVFIGARRLPPLLWAGTTLPFDALASCCSGFSFCRAHRLSCSVACGIFPGKGSNLCPLHWQADS